MDGTAVAAVERGFQERLARGLLLADGACGTLLAPAAGQGPCERLNLDDRRRVEELHLAYIRAGAAVIRTNTFAANRLQLARHGLADRVWELNVWGAKVARAAREVAGEPVWVAGSVGPLPAGTGAEAAAAALREQVEALLAGGVDLFWIETQLDARHAAAALAAVRACCRLPVVVTFTFGADDRTPAGQSVPEVLAILGDAGAAPPELVGVNCGLGPDQVLRLVRAFREAGWTGPLAAAPNAGPVTRWRGTLEYQAGPEDFARLLPALRAEGVRFVGGCCGTTPEHVRAMARALAGERDDPAPPAEAGGDPGAAGGPGGSPLGTAAVPAPPAPPTVWVGASREAAGDGPPAAGDGVPGVAGPRLRDRLGRRFVISVELDPPRGPVTTKFLADARRLRDAGVDCINVGDSPMARVRMGAIAAAYLIQAETGVETIVHFTTRDRNLMAIQADLLSAHALGIRNILALTGDNPSLGGSQASAVYDVDSIGLLRILAGLNQGRDVAGNALGACTDFTVACALSPNADDLEHELERFRRKLAEGPHFVMTQPLYEPEPLLRVLDRLGGCPVPILLGVMPLHSYKHALYLHREVPGIQIPAPVLEAMERAGDAGLEVGMELSERVVEALRPYIAGIYVVPSFGKVEPVAQFVERLRARAGA